MDYPKPIMTMRALMEIGFTEKFLKRAYVEPNQTFAWKSDATRKNSPILFDTVGLEKYRLERIQLEKRAIRQLHIV